MTFTDAIKSCIGKYATFEGRAPRSEYWWFYLFYVLVAVCLQAAFYGIGLGIGGVAGAGMASGVCSVLLALVFLLPSLAVMVRRLHDTGRSGWWTLLVFVPLLLVLAALAWLLVSPTQTVAVVLVAAYALLAVCSIWMLVLMLLGSDEENRYGLPVY